MKGVLGRMTPKDVRPPIPGIGKYATLHGRRCFADGIKAVDLQQVGLGRGRFPGLFKGVRSNHMSLESKEVSLAGSRSKMW